MVSSVSLNDSERALKIMNLERVMSEHHRLMLFTGSSNLPLALSVSGELNRIAGNKIPLAEGAVDRFNNTEVRVKLGQSAEESVRDAECIIIQSLCASSFKGKPSSVNDSIMELFMLVDALTRAGAHEVNVVTPVFAYDRQDHKEKPRDPISASMLARLLEAAGVERLMAIDLHSAAIQGFFRGPVDNLWSESVLCERIIDDHWTEGSCAVVSPDLGGTKRAEQLASRLGLPVATIVKRRPEPGVAEAVRIIGDVEGCRCIMPDDIIDTAGSIDAGARLLHKKGAEDICVVAAHGVFSDPAISRIHANEYIHRVYVTDTVPPPPDLCEAGESVSRSGKIVYVSVAGLLAKAIWCNHIGKSIHGLFA